MLNIELIEEAFENRNKDKYDLRDESIRESVDECLSLVDQGIIRVAEPNAGGWKVNEYIKKPFFSLFIISK